MKRLSIVTVVYNEADAIKYTLECIKNLKKRTQIEYIVIDGRSDDGTVDIIEEYSEIVDKFISEKDNGIYDAMNKGIRIANGEYVGLLNAGDTYEQRAFIENFGLFKSTTYDLFYGALNVLDEERNLILVNQAIHPNKMFFCGPKNLNHPTFFIRKEVYKDLGFYSLDFDTASDFEFLYKAFLHGYKFYNTGKVHTNFIKGGASYKKSPHQKIRIYLTYFSNKPVWSFFSLLHNIVIKYPKFMVVSFFSKTFHYKYMNIKNRFLG